MSLSRQWVRWAAAVAVALLPLAAGWLFGRDAETRWFAAPGGTQLDELFSDAEPVGTIGDVVDRAVGLIPDGVVVELDALTPVILTEEELDRLEEGSLAASIRLSDPVFRVRVGGSSFSWTAALAALAAAGVALAVARAPSPVPHSLPTHEPSRPDSGPGPDKQPSGGGLDGPRPRKPEHVGGRAPHEGSIPLARTFIGSRGGYVEVGGGLLYVARHHQTNTRIPPGSAVVVTTVGGVRYASTPAAPDAESREPGP